MPTELRVHGVSGTPPRELLYEMPVTYDQGGDLAKVYERKRDRWDVKAYHWGSLTSRSSATALWILMAPFAMANVAGWMSEAPNVWSRIWVRIAGLTLTGIFFAQAANMALDIPLASGTAPQHVAWLFLAASVLLVLGLGILSTQSTFTPLGMRDRLRYLFLPSVAAMHPRFKEPQEWDDPAEELSLVGTRLWTVHSIVHRLRRIHIAMGMGILSAVAARSVGDGLVSSLAIGLCGVMLLAVAGTSGRAAENRVVMWVTAIAPAVGAALLIWSATALFAGDVVGGAADELTYELALILGVAAGLGLIGELIRGGVRRGWVPLGLLAIAAFLGGTLGLTGSMLVETYLTGADTTAETFDGGAAFVTLGMLAMAVFVGLVFLATMIFKGKSDEETAYRRGILRARITLGSAGIFAAAIGGLAVYFSCNGAETGCLQANLTVPGWLQENPGNQIVFLGLPFDPASVLGWAKILMVAVPAFLIVRSIVGGLLNGQDSRRQVGILWDLGSFWPRWFHPLAPPAYGPYAVTRLQTTISELRPDVLAAHSQGSLISAVALSLMPNDEVPGRFVTYGSQIGELYPSLFPSVGFGELVESTDAQLGRRWINLWRPSDAIGGQIVEALGTRNWKVTTGTGHSAYELTPEFCAAREASGDLSRPDDSIIRDCWG